MTRFDINTVIKCYDLNVDDLANVLFPEAKYPKSALTRIIKGESSISVEQLEKLASYIGVVPSELFMLDTWKDATTNGHLAFKKGAFEVKLNYNGAYLTLYKNGEVIDKRVVVKDMAVDEFVQYLDDLINNY